MASRPVPVLLLLLLLLFPALFAHPSHAAGLGESARRGKRIYTEGMGRQPIVALLVGPGLRARGSAFPCVNCHRPDGRGIREGGVRSADITWFNLTKEFAGARASGRVHPPYDTARLADAVRRGVDPSGTPLDAAHPRYEISPEDLADLAEYIKVLGNEPVPGVDDDELRVGALLPDRGAQVDVAADVRKFLEGYFGELTARGGLFARRVRFVPVLFDPERPGSAAAAARAIVADEGIFCLLANVSVPAHDEANGVLGRAKVPVVGPLAVPPEGAYGMDPAIFYIHPSYHDQARVLVDALARSGTTGGAKIAILRAPDPAGDAAAAGARLQAGKHAFDVVADEPLPSGSFDAAAAVRRLRGKGADALFFFAGGGAARALLLEADRQEWRPRFLGLAAMTGEALLSLPASAVGRTVLASPSAPPGPGAKGPEEFLSILRKYGGSGRHRQSLATAYTAAALVEKGLRDAGRGVTRDAFAGILGKLYAFRTGITPPLTFDGNRRVGALGATLLRIDPARQIFEIAENWREPE